MPFTADLNPKSNKSMDLLDMVKMEDYLGRKGSVRQAEPKKPMPNNMVKSSADDVGTPFKFNSNQE